MTDLLVRDGFPLWIPIVVIRTDGKACICYADHNDDCDCSLPLDAAPDAR